MFDLARESSYLTPFANSTLLQLMLFSLATQKNSPSRTQKPSTIFSEYDFIIVGAGSGGSTVAGRLSECPYVNVLLLEAGDKPPKLNDIPILAKNFWFSDIDWKYRTVPQNHTGNGLINRQVVWPSGKGIGGSSLLNAMKFIRGNKKNYDDWAAQGAKGWSYKEVLPYFKKLEDNRNSAFVDNGYHGVGGPVTAENPRYDPEIRDPMLEAAKKMGYKFLDSNGPEQTGFNNFQGSLRNNQRCSTAKAYLVPAEKRRNLHILPNAFVNKVIIKKKRAIGVSFEVDGKLYEVKSRREVIMSAGTANTAKLLMLSGIGPRKELEKHNIQVIADLPVGENIQDHVSTVLNYEIDSGIPMISEKVSDPKNILRYIYTRSGPLSSPAGVSTIAFLNNKSIVEKVDFPTYQYQIGENSAQAAKAQFGLLPEVYKQVYGPYENKPFYSCFAILLQPKSRGFIRLQSSNARDPPLINPNYFDDASDLVDMVEAMKICQRIGTSDSMKSVGSKPFNTTYPGCEEFVGNEDDYFECHARSAVVTMSHPVGAAKMGKASDPSTVVDAKLRVKGIRDLRVVDASVMPIVPSGNTNIPTIMVAEKASDIIKESIGCPLKQENVETIYTLDLS